MDVDTVQFVDSVASSPTVRLDLNNEAPWGCTGVDFSPPQLKTAFSSTLLVDGERLTAAAYANRTLTLSLELIAGQDASATAMQALWRELDRPTNVIRYQPDGMPSPVFFRTIRSSDTRVREYPGGGSTALRTLEVQVRAESCAVGLRVDLPQVVVSNDPTASTWLNSNPFMEVDASGWTGTGGTIARSTAQSHEGAASLLLTPGGVASQVDVRSDLAPVTAGQQYRVAAWLRSTVARSISTNINWYDASSVYLSTSTTTASYSAGVWTPAELTATAPVGATQARAFPAVLGTTPPAGHTVYVDEARLYRVATAMESGGMCFDVTAVQGDVETPLFVRVAGEDVTTTPGKWTFGLGRRQTMISVRRRGTPAQAPGVFAAESLNRDADTSVVTGVVGAHGGSVLRTSFATLGLVIRYGPSSWPTAASVDLRGTYRMLVRCRKSVAGDVIRMRAVWSQDSTVVYGDLVTLPSDNVWRWIDLGLVQIPMGYDPATDGLSAAPLPATGPVFDTAIERVSGSGTLDSDSIAFVPADDRMLGVVWPTSGLPTAFVVDSAASGVYGVGASGEVRSARVETTGLPPMVSPGVTNRVWFLADVGSEFATGDDAAGYARITPYYWPRYLHVRPVAS
ncbi:hypothetical protein ACH5AJ_36475 [Streptomyces rochei]|uniref:hypothetical protein n=1 Tax=Streptomyces rochei TaxID=1928 RepID=UPI0037B6D86E